jgi:hypothetical protein
VDKVEKGNLLKEIGDVSCELFGGDKHVLNRLAPSNALPQSHPQRLSSIDHRLITTF